MTSESISARLYEPQVEAVDDLVDHHGMKKSEAIRRLIQDGIEHREGDNTESDSNDTTPLQVGQLVGWAVLSVSVAALSLGATTAAGTVAAAAAAVFLGTAADHYRGGDNGE